MRAVRAVNFVRAGLDPAQPDGPLFPVHVDFRPAGDPRPPPQHYQLWSPDAFATRRDVASRMTPTELKKLRAPSQGRDNTGPNRSALRDMLAQGLQHERITNLPLPDPDSAVFVDGWNLLLSLVKAINRTGKNPSAAELANTRGDFTELRRLLGGAAAPGNNRV